MKEPQSIPANGTKLRVVSLNTDEVYLRAMFVPDYRKAMRRAGEVVEMAGYVAGHGGDMWWCRHANGDVAPYCWEELEYEPNDSMRVDE
jgi:hypothetical protein